MFSGFFQAVGSTLRTLQMGFSSKNPDIDTRNVEVFPLTNNIVSDDDIKPTYTYSPEFTLAYTVILPNSSGNSEIDSEDDICKHAGYSDLCDATGCYFTKSLDDLVSIDLNNYKDRSLIDMSGNCQCANTDLSGCDMSGCILKGDDNRSNELISGVSGACDLSGCDFIAEDSFKSCDNLYSIEKHCYVNKIWYSKELSTDEIKKHLDID